MATRQAGKALAVVVTLAKHPQRPTSQQASTAQASMDLRPHRINKVNRRTKVQTRTDLRVHRTRVPNQHSNTQTSTDLQAHHSSSLRRLIQEPERPTPIAITHRKPVYQVKISPLHHLTVSRTLHPTGHIASHTNPLDQPADSRAITSLHKTAKCPVTNTTHNRTTTAATAMLSVHHPPAPTPTPKHPLPPTDPSPPLHTTSNKPPPQPTPNPHPPLPQHVTNNPHPTPTDNIPIPNNNNNNHTTTNTRPPQTPPPTAPPQTTATPNPHKTPPHTVPSNQAKVDTIPTPQLHQ